MASGQVNLGLLILRCAVGGTMIAHGYNHVWRGGRIAGTGRWFASLGMKPGRFHAWLASGTELAAGAGLVVGLLTPLAAGACAGVMIVAWIINHLKNGFFIFRPGEGFEYVMNLALVSLAIACLGPGDWSLDNAIDFEPSSWWGLTIGALIGVGGAATLLAVFWRPPKKEPAPTA